ncbi:MAG: segregation/condensation protein A [Candidatus Aenigmarchaeota archaeon]|nr:segregation/condensation protein A [Candidatus Aenigmarchaeota archaeon]
MLNDQQLIDLMVSEPSWEDVIVKIVAEEEMDPWSVDIIRLSNVFLDYVTRMEGMDLRIPARFILIASILLRMKSDVLSKKKERVLIPESEKEPDDMLRVLAQVPPLEPPIKRLPLRNVSLDELIGALRKAYDVQDRRVQRKRKRRSAVRMALPKAEEDISERIDRLLGEINQALMDVDNIEFSRVVKKWARKEIVQTLIPLLHLAQDGKINLMQNELFKEITVKIRKQE